MDDECSSASGVYVIRCIPTGKVYVGSSVDVPFRWRNHLWRLGLKIHHSILLQRAWDKYGEDQFTWEIIETCDTESLIEREQHHIDAMHSADPLHGFNICPTAGSSLGVKMSKETREKMSASQMGKPVSAEARAKISAAKKGNPGSRGIPVSEETRAKMSASKRGYAFTPEHCEKIRQAHIGMKHTDETKAKMSEKRRGKKHGPLTEEHKAKISAGRKGKGMGPRSPEAIENIRIAAQNRTPDHCARISAALLEHYRALRESKENREGNTNGMQQ